MSTNDDQLRQRLARLERTMPDALPLDLREVGAVERPRRRVEGFRWPAGVLLLLGAVLAGMLVGGGGLLLLAPREPETPVLPAGLFRSATPVDDPVCVSLELPVRSAAGGPEQQRVWWWPRGPRGCGQRTDFIYVQWVQPTPARITADGAPRDGVRFQLVAELRDGSRHDLDFVLDPMAEAADDGSLLTYAAGGRMAGVTLLPIDDYDALEEVTP